MVSTGEKSYRGLTICCAVCSLVLIIIIVVLVVLFLTILRPKQPQVIALPVILKHIIVEVFPAVDLNATLALVVTVNNRNYGSFNYEDTTASLNYHGEVVAEAPIESGLIPARRKHNISSSVEIIGAKLTTNPSFWDDVDSGILNFTSLTTLHGKVSVLKILKMHANVHCNCDISVFVKSATVDSICRANMKL